MKKNFVRTVIAVMLLLTACFAVPAQASGKTYTGTFRAGLKSASYKVRGSWKKRGKKYRFVRTDGRISRGWLKIGKKVYYLDKKGFRKTGLVKVSGKYYYFSSRGVQKTGRLRVNGRTYFFDPADNGARVIASITANGIPNAAPAREKAGKDKTVRKTGYALKYDKKGTFYDSKGYALEKSTLKRLLTNALKPVGRTMYIYGGGWTPKGNRTGNGGSVETVRIGVSPRWEQFFQTTSAGYNYRNYSYLEHLGLDCSGYVGWVLYNSFNSADGHGDFVMSAQNMARTFSNWGWGSYTPAGQVSTYQPGDIMSLGSGHVYIVIGKCSDGSVVLVHSSPRGVMISGTATRAGNRNSKAVKLAKKYMKKYYPAWYRKYPDSSRGSSYLTSYSKMSWYLKKKKSVMSDPDGLSKKSADKVLKILFKGGKPL